MSLKQPFKPSRFSQQGVVGGQHVLFAAASLEHDHSITEQITYQPIFFNVVVVAIPVGGSLDVLGSRARIQREFLPDINHLVPDAVTAVHRRAPPQAFEFNPGIPCAKPLHMAGSNIKLVHSLGSGKIGWMNSPRILVWLA